MKKLEVREKILSVAESLVQMGGYNAFSYKNIAKIVGVKTSSIHYYFPNKSDLGVAIIERHIQMLCDELSQLNDKKISCKKKLELFIDNIIKNTYSSDRKMCLGGMFASDVLTLPENIQVAARSFFQRLQDWVKELFAESIKQNEFSIEKKDIKSETLFIFSLIEGALLLARLFQDEGYLIIAKKNIITRYMKD